MPTQKLSRLFFTIFFSIILLANHTILVFSQTPQLVPTDTVKAEKVIEPVQLSNIGIETEKTLSILRDQRNIIKPTDTEIAIDSLIPVKLERINELKDQLNLEEIEQMKLRQTENLKNDFVQYQVQFSG
jgi:hypothetical protein